MLKFEVVLLGLFISCCSVSARRSSGTYIVGGSVIPIESAPHQAYFTGSGECGAVIIGQNHLLTAAHCLHGQNAENLRVVVGTDDVMAPGPTHRVTQFVIHPKYSGNDIVVWYNDIAVVWVTPSIEYNSRVQPIPLATVAPPVNAAATTTGFGTTCPNCSTSRYLRQVDVQVLDWTECNRAYGNSLDESQLCAGLWEGGADACTNDSGGPLVVDGQLVGITSFGTGCGTPGFPGVYANVAYFEPWVREHVGSASNYYVF